LTSKTSREPIGALLVLYFAASLLHFAHNAEYLTGYPNLPVWLGRSDVYLVWIAQTAVGLGGYTLYRRERQQVGLLLIAVYAAAGFDGLLHYTRAPFAAHTAAMNFTIGFELVAAGLLLIAVVAAFAKRRSREPA
jgi:hypothetical protein